MVPFYFGAPDTQLFGVYYPPAGAGLHQDGVLISAPVAHEHIRTHMAIRQLALALSAAGRHVLKFDYYGVGDSAGKSAEGSMAQWHRDLVTASHELTDISGARRLSVVGIRLGASLAVGAAGDLPGLRELVLWDPVVDGDTYLDDLRRAGGVASPDHGDEEILGFPFSQEMIASIGAVNLLVHERPLPGSVHLALSEERPEYDRFKEALVAAGNTVDTTFVPEPAGWDKYDGHDEVLVANAMVQAIGEQLLMRM
ncbi:serine aminopeptidase domain-containing protein [Desulfoluna spongiiphila]|uniref:serine aminopeptidase domain-containing protein n=1 Tax=Desulfoluna spongiiphila TaxID=419481 RepID=UPI001259EC75|nr:alpha/beta hydrolase [Desulfoluna spongiiphila]VVS94091.1 alpha/beta hydrolase fold [Desulfoluna spongiiphila]